MRPTIQAVVRFGLVVGAALVFWRLINRPDGLFDDLWVRGGLKLALWVVPAVMLTAVLSRVGVGNAWRRLGFVGAAWRGYAFGVLATLPLGVAWLIRPGAWPGGDAIVGDIVLGPIAEEALFRGFLFLALRRLGVRFWPAAVASALAFGLAHVPNLEILLQHTWVAASARSMADLAIIDGAFELTRRWSEMAAITLQIGAGGLLFAWVCERGRSLWWAIGLHAAINFWWEMVHGVEVPVAPGIWANAAWSVGSALTVGAAVLLVRHAGPREPADRPADVALGQGAIG
ncbi:MAG: type II CAAX endopeptidase family protein, partial [Vicinamibacterales bacterium]